MFMGQRKTLTIVEHLLAGLQSCLKSRQTAKLMREVMCGHSVVLCMPWLMVSFFAVSVMMKCK